MYDCNAAEARQLIVQKQALELSLSWDMYEVFSTVFIKPLRRACGEAVKEVDRVLGANPQFQTDFPREWSFYSCMRGLKKWDGHRLYQWTWKWSPFECGDWIRVYGEIVEKGYFGADVDVDRKAPQRELANSPLRLWGKHQKKGYGAGQLDQGRQKLTDLRRRAETSALHERQDYQYGRLFGASTPARDLATSMPHSGIKKWAILDNDLTGKIDRYFGLLRGATISGTTTDNIFFIGRFSRIDTGRFRHTDVVSDKIFALLPIATIGAGGHHSLLEIALPLALNGFIDYSIGLYGSLLPTQYAYNDATREGAQAIHGFLTAYGHRGSAFLVLCYYDRHQLAGCFVAEPSEIAVWRSKFRVADETFLRSFTRRPAYPTRQDIIRFAQAMGLNPRPSMRV